MPYFNNKWGYLNPPAPNKSQRKISWPIKEVLGQLDSDDYSLVDIWLRDEEVRDPHRQAQLLSARLAERVTAGYYSRLGYHVQDISLSQIQSNPGDWQHFDLLLDGKIPVDVKNARTTINNKKYYLNHCVPRFKFDRMGKEVIIASVMSPYLNLAQIQMKEFVRSDIPDLIFLGEATHAEILLLEKEFTSEYLKINICGFEGEKTFIPAWFFDYFISRTNLSFNSLDSQPLFPLSERQKEFKQRINIHPHLKWSLPVLYLSIWSDFLQKINVGEKSLKPLEYYSVYKSKSDTSNPLGIRDPQDIIFELIRCLIKLNFHREEISRYNIDRYILKGQDSLIGLSREGERRTLIAYCGGTIPGMGKCGNGPLIIGSNEICPTCGKLICDQCDFCSYQCRRSAIEKSTVDDDINF